MILADTSVWIEFLRDHPTEANHWLRARLATGDPPAVADPVVMEVLSGLAAHDVPGVELFLDGLVCVHVVPESDYVTAAAIYRDVRRTGRTIRQLNHCLIAAVALRTGSTLVHKDVDFEVIAEIFQLDHLSLR